MKTFATILVAFVAIASLSGCGENPVSPISISDDANPSGQLSDIASATTGKALFDGAQSHAIQTLSLSEITQLTPYLAGTKSIENASLSEVAAITPVVVKFQAAFKAELAAMSVGEVNRVLNYMESMEMNKFPYPQIEDARDASQAA